MRSLRSLGGATILIAMWLFTLPVARAEVRALTLEEAIRLGLANNPGLASERSMARVSEAARQEAAAERWPLLTAEAAARRTDHPVMVFGDKLTSARFTADDFAIDRLNHPDPVSHMVAALSLQVPIYTAGRISASTAAAGSAASAAQARVRAAASDLAAQIAEAYYAVPLERAAAEVAESAVADARGHESVAAARAEAGSALRSDLLRARVLRLARQLALSRKLADVEIARARLGRLLGLGPDVQPEPSSTLAPPEQDLGELETWTERAIASRAEVAAARSAAESAEAAERSARAGLAPAVSGLARYERNADGFDAGEGSYVLGVSLRWDAYDRARGSRLSAASARQAAAAEQTRAVVDAVRLEVEQAWRDATVADHALEVARDMVEAAEEARRIAAERYAAGLLPITDLLDVETQLESARLGQIGARFDAIVGRTRLQRAAGVLEVSP